MVLSPHQLWLDCHQVQSLCLSGGHGREVTPPERVYHRGGPDNQVDNTTVL
jgi:hypothetical protein